LFLVAEFLHMITASFLIVILFMGGWHLWGVTGSDDNVTWLGALLRVAILSGKIVLVILFFMLTRWSWPRFRFDQLMALAWKIMLPLGLANLVVVAILYELRVMVDPDMNSRLWDLGMMAVTWATCFLGWMAVASSGTLVTDNTPRRNLQAFDIDSQL
jgi:NADH-quinone oxidoreductase subunit H